MRVEWGKGGEARQRKLSVRKPRGTRNASGWTHRAEHLGNMGLPASFSRPRNPPPPRPRVDSDPKPPYGLGVCIWMHPVNGTGNSPVSGTADPRNGRPPE